MTGPIQFAITLRQLAPDATLAGIDLPEIERTGVTTAELRTLLEALTALAPQVAFPLRPEIRIVSPHGTFLVQVRDGHLRFSSWSLRGADRDYTPEQICAAIQGLEAETGEEEPRRGPAALAHAMPSARALKIVFLCAAIFASNGVTAWLLTRPPSDLLPPYRRVATETANRTLAEVAGSYVTGADDGDRGLQIAADGAVQWFTYGPNRTVSEQDRFKVEPVQVADQRMLLTTTRALIEIKDSVTVRFYGDTYQRRHL